MIYTYENTKKIGKRMAKVFDADGQEYFLTTLVDTDAGWIEYYEQYTDPDTKEVSPVVDANGVHVKRKVKARLPIKIIWWSNE